MTGYSIALRTQPADPAGNDVLYIDGNVIPETDATTRRRLVGVLSDLSLRGIEAVPGFKVSRRRNAAITRMIAISDGRDPAFVPSITIAVQRQSDGLNDELDHLLEHVLYFLRLNSFSLGDEEIRRALSTMLAITSRRGGLMNRSKKEDDEF